MERYPDFDQWFDELKDLADSKEVPGVVNRDDPDSYRVGWEQGMTPQEELDIQVDACW